MKKFLSKSLLFLIVIGALYPVAIYIAGTYLPTWLHPNLQYLRNGDGYMLQRLSEADTLSDVDILLLGSSHTYQAYHPEDFPEYSTMNLGSSNQTHVQTAFLLKTYLSTLRPRLVIYELNPNMLYNGDTESTLDIISNSSIQKSTSELWHKDNFLQALHTSAYKFISLELLGQDVTTPTGDAHGDRYIKRGFVIKDRGDNTKFSPHEYIFMPTIHNPRALDALHESIEMLTAHKIPIIFVYTPITRGFYNYTSGEQKVTRIFDPSRYPFYNFNELFNWNDTSDFYDEHHLSQQGVRLYDQRIKPIIDSVFNTHYRNQ